MDRPGKSQLRDWAVLKYGWLIVVLVHVVFLGLGVQQIRSALDMFDPELLNISQLRLDHVIQATYMVTIAFSVILLILAVFILEIFRTQRAILNELQELRDVQEAHQPRPSAPPQS
jgi:hypothetical protein